VIPLVVFDTSVLLSGIGWRGKPFHALNLARSGQVVGLTCNHIIAEVAEKLRVKLDYSADRIDEKVADLLTFLRTVEVPGTLRVIADDPDDDPIVECAVRGQAQYIVTGDKRHLLPLGSFQGIRIVTPAQLLELVAAP
jgi:uncharacterized protein